ncbi:MAG: 50S ribosomal protein L16 [Candidatus Anstonellales archaeon]
MALRPASCVRDMDKVAWTRFSKSKPRKSYIKSLPHRHLNQFVMGTKKEDYDLTLELVAQKDVIVRDNSLESARQAVNRYLEKAAPGNYYFIVMQYPHHVIRENRMVATAGADRIQQGMRRSFGKPTSRAARIYKGRPVFVVSTYKQYESKVRESLLKAPKKMSGAYKIKVSSRVAA